MRVVETREDLYTDSGDARRGVVMTMGALHEGHADLIRAARDRDEHVTVTIFVNPMQFGPQEDLARYPRTLQADLELCERLGVNTVYVPQVADVYPRTPVVTVDPGTLGTELEGVVRPTHFRGVLTVVCKLLRITSPDFWEVIDRGANFDYMDDVRKAHLKVFFSWFQRVPPPDTAALQRPGKDHPSAPTLERVSRP